MSQEDKVELAIRDSVKFPLTAQSKLAATYRYRLDKAIDNKKKCELLNKQLKGIDSIKQHIAERKTEFLCHQRERLREKIQQREQLKKDILVKHKLSLKNEGLRQRIADQLLQYNNMQKKKILGQKERMMNIIQKIVTEYEGKEEGKKEEDKKEKKTKIKDTIVTSTTLERYSEIKEELEEETEIWEDIEPEPSKPVSKKKKERKKKQKKEKVKEAKPKKKKAPKVVKKGSKKEDKEKFVMPHAPMLNPRHKIQYVDDVIPVTISDYEKFLQEETDYFMKQNVTYPEETKFTWSPSSISFLDFENNVKYKQKLTIYNISVDSKYCKYLEIKSTDDFSSINIQVEETGVHKLHPSNNFSLTIFFSPKNLKNLSGKLMFTTRVVDKPEIKVFGVPFKCQVASTDIEVSPTNIFFKAIPIWNVEKYINKCYKTIQVKNNMNYECILVIRKVRPHSTPEESIEHFEEFAKEIPVGIKKSKLTYKELPVESEETNEELSASFVLNKFFENMTDTFQFSSHFYVLPPKSLLNVKVFLNNLFYVGNYQDVFELEFLRKKANEFIILKHEILLVQIEITGKFIVTNTEYLDYNICVLNSVYQQQFQVTNYGMKSYKIGIQFPSKLKQYLSAFPPTFFLKSHGSETVSLRFIPRKEILTSGVIYYDLYTGILTCPIKMCILSSQSLGIPPTTMTIFALLTKPDEISIITKEMLLDDGYPVIHFGNVTTQESVTTDFEIQNNSALRQEFGFLNLPEPILIHPDYGFGSLNPNETKTLNICFSPTVSDMITTDVQPTPGHSEVCYKIFCSTAYKLGGVRQDKKHTKNISKMYSRPKTATLNLQDLFDDDFKDNYVDISSSKTSKTNKKEEESTAPLSPIEDFALQEAEQTNDFFDEFVEEDEEEVVVKKLCVVVKANVINYWTELSHQYVIFADTPLSSYSTMDVLFSAINHNSFNECVCGFVKKDKTIFECHFEVTGGCEEITIEPICGNLKKGESVHLLLIAKPTIKQHILYETAKIYKFKKLQAKSSKRKGSKKSKKKVSAKASKKGTKSPQDKGKVPLRIPDNISLHNCDYYPAEKEIWKSMIPYTIKTMFTFTVTFPEHFNKQDETLYLTAECKVIRPEFVTDLETQCIDFGPTIINTRPKKVFMLENISRQLIMPKISPLRPSGPFICTIQLTNGLEKEHLLKIPITFAPEEEKFYQEYFEIKSGNTIESLIVSGEGVKQNIEFLPEFTVCRLQVKRGKPADCTFQVSNDSKAPLSLSFLKICELKGLIEPKPIVQVDTVESPVEDSISETTDSRRSKRKGKADKKTSKKAKVKKFTNDLTNEEEYSIKNNFENYTEPSQFRIMHAINDKILMEPFSKLKIKVRFDPTKPQPDKKEKKDHSPRELTPKSKDDPKTVYLAKYNIMLDNLVSIKDIIVLTQTKK